MDYLERSWTLTESWVMASQLVDIPSQPRDQGTVGANTEVEKENNSHGLHRETRGRTRRRQSSSLSPGKGTTDGASTPSIFVILFNLHKTSTKWALLVSFLQKKKLNIQNNQVIAKRQSLCLIPKFPICCVFFVCLFFHLSADEHDSTKAGRIHRAAFGKQEVLPWKLLSDTIRQGCFCITSCQWTEQGILPLADGTWVSSAILKSLKIVKCSWRIVPFIIQSSRSLFLLPSSDVSQIFFHVGELQRLIVVSSLGFICWFPSLTLNIFLIHICVLYLQQFFPFPPKSPFPLKRLAFFLKYNCYIHMLVFVSVY